MELRRERRIGDSYNSALRGVATLANGVDWQDNNFTTADGSSQNAIAVDAANGAGDFRLREP